MNAEELIEAVSKMTPAAEWREKGEPDPHGKRYDCERSGLTLGDLTDDLLANAVFMHGDQPLNVAAVLAGEPSPHCYLVAAKDRIRWLSRRTVKLEAENAVLIQRVAELEKDAGRYRWLRHGDNDELVMRSVADGGGSRPFDYKIDGCWLPRNHELDAAIDAAISNASPNVRDAGPTPYSGRTTRRDEG